MTVEHSEERSTNGLATLWNLIVAPPLAFSALRERPTWIAAFIVTAAAGTVAAFAMTPANIHALIGTLSPEERQYSGMATTVVRYWWPLSALNGLIAALFSALVLLAASALGGGSSTFRRLFALAMNVAFISFGLAQIVAAAIVVARGADSFNSPLDIALASPTAAWLVPSAPPKVAAFLCGIGPFSLWSLALLGAGTVALSGIRKALAYGAATLLILLSCISYAVAVK